MKITTEKTQAPSPIPKNFDSQGSKEPRSKRTKIQCPTRKKEKNRPKKKIITIQAGGKQVIFRSANYFKLFKIMNPT